MVLFSGFGFTFGGGGIFFPGGGGWANFWLVGEGLPPLGKTLACELFVYKHTETLEYYDK